MPVALAPATPDGFEPVTDDTGRMATMLAVGRQCAQARSVGLNVSDVAELHLFLRVDPPDRYQADIPFTYLLPFDGMVGQEPLQDRYRSWNLSVDAGQTDASSTDEASAGPAALRRGRVAVDGENLTAELRSAVAGSPLITGLSFRRTFAVQDGNVTDVVDAIPAFGPRYLGRAKLVVTDTAQPPTQWTGLNGFGTGEADHTLANFTLLFRWDTSDLPDYRTGSQPPGATLGAVPQVPWLGSR